MKNYKIIFAYIIIILVMGCAAKKKEYQSVSTAKSDTLILKTESVVLPPLATSITVNELCDSLTGKPKEFSQYVAMGKDTVFIEVLDNELLFRYSQLEKVIKQQDSVIKIKNKEVIDVKKSEFIEYRWARITWVLLGIVVLFLILPVIPTYINKIAKKLIGL